MASFGLANPSGIVASGASGPVDVATIFSAASEGNLALLQSAMTELNFSLMTPDENGYTLLHAAASYSQLGVLRFILESLDRSNPVCSSFINVGDNDGDTALHYAGSVDAARMLIEDGRIDAKKLNNDGKHVLQAKMEELAEMKQDEDINDDDEDLEATQEIIEYLSTLE